MKKSWMMASSAVLSLCLVGCGGNNDDTAMNNNNDGQGVQINQVGTRNVNNTNNNQNGRLTISDRAERQVEQMEEIDEAHVIISNNNAYVAVRLNNDNHAAGNRNNHGQNGENTRTGNTNNNIHNNENAGVNNGMDGNARTFIENGTVNQDDNNVDADDGIIDGKGDAGGGNRQNTGAGNGENNNGGNNMNLFGIGNGDDNRANNGANNNNRANGDNTGEIAPLQNNYHEVSNTFEQKIADQVRQADKKIHNVYVSNNPDLYSRMNTFADDIRTNGNRDGLFEDFNNMVNGFFGR